MYTIFISVFLSMHLNDVSKLASVDLARTGTSITRLQPVSYTHLDVYKRQVLG